MNRNPEPWDGEGGWELVSEKHASLSLTRVEMIIWYDQCERKQDPDES